MIWIEILFSTPASSLISKRFADVSCYSPNYFGPPQVISTSWVQTYCLQQKQEVSLNSHPEIQGMLLWFCGHRAPGANPNAPLTGYWGANSLSSGLPPRWKRVSSLDWKNVFGRNIRRNWGNVLILMQVMKESPGWMKIQVWFLVDWWVWVWQLLDFMKLHILKMGNPPSSRWWQVWEHPQLHSSGTPESRSRCTPHLEVWQWVELQTGSTMGRVSLEMKHYRHGMESWRL